MKKIPLQARAKRPQFFDDMGLDPIVTMTTELMTELWVVKERLFAVEKILDESGLDVRQKLEDCEFSKNELAELEQKRRQFVETIMRAFSAESIQREKLQNQVDALTESMKQTDNC